MGRSRIPWIFRPFVALWRLLALVIGLTGRLIALVLGLSFLALGVVLTLTVLGAPVGLPLVVFGFLLLLRSLF